MATIHSDLHKDIVATGGVIRIVDTVLQIPADAVTLLTTAKLNYTIEIISQWDFVDGITGPNATNLATLADITVFVPNSAHALAMASNMTGIGQTARDMVGAYHLVMGNIAYSVDLVNGTSLNSKLGLPLLITVGVDGQIYVNMAKILTSDYLMYCSGEIGRVGTDKSADPLSSRDRNLGQKPHKNPFLDRFQTIIHRGSLLVSNIVLFLHKLSLIVLFLGPI